jgi:tetratricopeptide (TPR) repeat protein
MRTIFLLALAAVSTAFGADAQSSFEAHKYSDAAQQQAQALATAPPNAEGYYNLGIASEKAGDPAQAALNYERALLLDPGLRPARNALGTLAASKSIPIPPHAWTDDVTAVVHPDMLVLLGTALFWAGAFGLLIAAQARRRRGVATTLAILALILGTAAQTAGWLSDGRLAAARPAVVTAKEGAEVLTAPANNSTPVVSLPPGTPVGVLSPRGAWTYIDVNGGARGWVQTERLTPVVPGETL